ncbi:MAG: energy transducer TonB [bacterium]|nr:energy transducer TonB [bacterium]
MNESRPIGNIFSLALAISLLLHITFINTFNLPSLSNSKFEPLSITLLSPVAPKPAVQIVSPPEVTNTDLSKDANYLSDTNATVEKESIRRGMPGAPEIGPSKQSISKPPQPETLAEKKSQPQKENKKIGKMPTKSGLKLSDPSLLEKYSKISKTEAKENQELSQETPREFSRAAGSGAAFVGSNGMPDYLPNLPDGDLTLLNTKASQFAVFVRRVATRVFGQMRQSGWDYLTAQDILRISGMSIVNAQLDKTGKIIKVSIRESSGSQKFDQVLIEAVKRAVEDKNPPPGALADDGNFHFIFQSRSWVRPATGRSGQPTQQRWLLLGTGLE